MPEDGIGDAARLQGFPDTFSFIGSKSSVYRQIGNAVPPQLARAVMTSVLDALDGGAPGARACTHPHHRPDIMSCCGRDAVVLYHRQSEACAGANAEMVPSGPGSPRFFFELRGTGCMGSGIYCTAGGVLPGGGCAVRLELHPDDMYVVRGWDERGALEGANRAMLAILWEAVHDGGGSCVEDVASELRSALGIDVDASGAISRAIVGAYERSGAEEGAMVAQPLTIALMEMGYLGLMYGGEMQYLNDEYAWGAIVFPKEASIILPGDGPRRVPYTSLAKPARLVPAPQAIPIGA